MKRYIVTPDDAKHPMDILMVEVQEDGCGLDSTAYVYERDWYSEGEEFEDIAQRDNFSSVESVEFHKSWEGSTSIDVDGYFNNHEWSPELADKLGFLLKVAAYLCDQVTAAESIEWNNFADMEAALGHLNCMTGADENPGITVVEIPYVEEPEPVAVSKEVSEENKKAFLEALTQAGKNRPETHCVQITVAGMPLEPYYFEAYNFGDDKK